MLEKHSLFVEFFEDLRNKYDVSQLRTMNIEQQKEFIEYRVQDKQGEEKLRCITKWQALFEDLKASNPRRVFVTTYNPTENNRHQVHPPTLPHGNAATRFEPDVVKIDLTEDA
eukprot:897039_1